jgi:hypothetical protein
MNDRRALAFPWPSWAFQVGKIFTLLINLWKTGFEDELLNCLGISSFQIKSGTESGTGEIGLLKFDVVLY